MTLRNNTEGPSRCIRVIALIQLGILVLITANQTLYLSQLLRYETNSDSVEDYEWQRTSIAGENLLVFMTYADLASRICLMVFMYRTLRNLRTLGVPGLRHSPIWGIVGFLIPILHLFIPYRIAQDLWRAHTPVLDERNDPWTLAPRNSLIVVWWILFIGSGLTYAAFAAAESISGNSFSFTFQLLTQTAVAMNFAELIILLIWIQQLQHRINAFYHKINAPQPAPHA